MDSRKLIGNSPSMASVQFLFDGGTELPETQALGFPEFLQIAKRESGLLPFADAARVLGVSRGRITQLVQKGQLRPFRFFGESSFVSGREVLERLKTVDKRGGRPRIFGLSVRD